MYCIFQFDTTDTLQYNLFIKKEENMYTTIKNGKEKGDRSSWLSIRCVEWEIPRKLVMPSSEYIFKGICRNIWHMSEGSEMKDSSWIWWHRPLGCDQGWDRSRDSSWVNAAAADVESVGFQLQILQTWSVEMHQWLFPELPSFQPQGGVVSLVPLLLKLPVSELRNYWFPWLSSLQLAIVGLSSPWLCKPS